MTTNVLDCVNGFLSTDSRWSSSSGDCVAYVDNTNYDKLAYTTRVGFLFAGDMPPIDAWKSYVIGGMKKGTRPEIVQSGSIGTRISVIQVELATGKIVFQSHKFVNSSFSVLIKALFAGTGALYAKACWDTNKCARMAIESAARDDMCSGGNVVFLNRATRETNVTNTATSQSVHDQLKERGIFMDAQRLPVSLKDAANDPSKPEAQAFAIAVMSGASPLCAPFYEMDKPWTEEKIAEFDVALSEYEVD